MNFEKCSPLNPSVTEFSQIFILFAMHPLRPDAWISFPQEGIWSIASALSKICSKNPVKHGTVLFVSRSLLTAFFVCEERFEMNERKFGKLDCSVLKRKMKTHI